MKILFNTPWFPTPPVNGSKIRIFNLIKSLAVKHKIDLISFIRDHELIDYKGIQPYCSTIKTVPYQEFHPNNVKALMGFLNPKPRSLVESYNRTFKNTLFHQLKTVNYDLAIFSEMSTASYLDIITEIPTIFEDVESGVFFDAYINADSLISRFRNKLTWIKYSSYLHKMSSYFSKLTVVSEIEKNYLTAQNINSGKIKVIPNGIDVDYFKITKPHTSHSRQIIYTGALTYKANMDAMLFFVKEIFPKILHQLPDIQLVITGSTYNVDIKPLINHPNIKFTGFVPDIRPVIADSWLSIVPLRIGGGTRLKILESMAMRTPVVSTTKGAEGLDISSEENILIGDTPIKFANHVIRLFNNPNLRNRLADKGRKLVEEHYNWDKIGAQFLNLSESVASERDKLKGND